jgi:hypothetical protein
MDETEGSSRSTTAVLDDHNDYKERWSVDPGSNQQKSEQNRQFKFKEAGVDRFNDYYDDVDEDQQPY